MSVENNSLRTIDGLNTIQCDVINVVESIEIDGDNGLPNQILSSDGTRTLWSTLSSLLEQLSVNSPLSFVSGTFYDGSVARALQIADGAIQNVKLEYSTISGVSLGSNLYNLNVSNPLSFSGSPPNNYDGSQTKTIQIANGAISNLKLEYSTISGISLGGDLNTLTLTSPLSFTSGTEYDGSVSRTIQITNIPNSALQNSTISGVILGGTLNSLYLGNGLYGVNGGGTPTIYYDGSQFVGVSVLTKGGGGISNGATGIFLTNNSTTLGSTTLTLGSTTTDLNMGNNDIKSANLLDGSNKLTNERLSYEDTGIGVDRWLYTLHAGDWRPNDDSTSYNIIIEDDTASLMGRAKTGLSSLEAIAILNIPHGWSVGKIFIDCRDTLNNNLSRTYYLYKIYNWGGTGSTYLGSYTTNSETSVSYLGTTYGAGQSQYSLLIKMMLTATTDNLGGGYITLTPP